MLLHLFRRRLAAPTALSLVCLVGACALPPPTQAPAGFQAPAGAATSRPLPGPDGTSRPSPSARDLAADPNRFKGLGASEVIAKLGDPSYRRREAPAEVWQYYGPGCVLDLFLYEEKGSQKVVHFELRNNGLQTDGGTTCLSELLDGKRGSNS